MPGWPKTCACIVPDALPYRVRPPRKTRLSSGVKPRSVDSHQRSSILTRLMAAKWPPGQARRAARCRRIGQAPQRPQEAISPHRRPRAFARSPRCRPPCLREAGASPCGPKPFGRRVVRRRQVVVHAPRRGPRLTSGQRPSGQTGQYQGPLVFRARASRPTALQGGGAAVRAPWPPRSRAGANSTRSKPAIRPLCAMPCNRSSSCR